MVRKFPLVLALLFVFAAPAWADFAAGQAAYKRGDYKTAIREFTAEANRGNADAQSNLGIMYGKGLGVARNYAEAAKWFRKAAAQGHAAAQNILGVMYNNGQGVTRNYAEALKWFHKAAEQGNAAAQLNLGVIYADGQGAITRNDAEAMRWYRKASEQGDADAQFRLGAMYVIGRSVPRNLVCAYMWISLAAAQGNSSAAEGADDVEKQMTPADVSRAQGLAAAWKPGGTACRPR